ncbi:S-layer homology domain-containing protein [Solibacillus sp. FSL W7-1464]|uniref:S-layer homology domain-containing protein n=1 Tax=Solibacillus sp. FSL W7-1464 TaxID=2921706 RepID=UPI0030FC4754
MKKGKTSQKLFKTVLAASVMTGAVTAVAPMYTDAAKPAISDISNNEHREAIISLLDRGVVGGFSDGTYKPKQQVTRGEAAKIIAKVLDLDTQNAKDPEFTDISKNHPYYGEIAALVNAGIISGYEDKTYKSGNPLTRGQMAKILSVAFGFQEEQLKGQRFTDVIATNWYSGFVQALLTNNITSGTSATTFSPNDFVTRGQLASFVVRSEKAAAVKNPSPIQPQPTQPKDEDTKPVTDPNEGKTETPQKPSQAEIEQKYMTQLSKIEGEANQNINRLLSEATSDYETKKANGEKIQLSDFISKYMGAASGLESQTDAAFNSVVSQLEAELAANGYSTESVKSISDSYNASKESLRNSILGQFGI